MNTEPPKTVWRPLPSSFAELPKDHRESALMKRETVIRIMRAHSQPMTMRQVSEALLAEGKYYAAKAKRIMLYVADPTHDVYGPRGKHDYGWTLKKEYR